jgi:hypothetical protein
MASTSYVKDGKFTIVDDRGDREDFEMILQIDDWFIIGRVKPRAGPRWVVHMPCWFGNINKYTDLPSGTGCTANLSYFLIGYKRNKTSRYRVSRCYCGKKINESIQFAAALMEGS